VQGELNVDIYHNEDVTERIESDDPTKPAVIHKKTVHVSVPEIPSSARHEITLRQNPRKKGSAFYGGYETDCSFHWQLRNPSDTTKSAPSPFPCPLPTRCMTASSPRSTARTSCRKWRSRTSLVLEPDVQAEAMDFTLRSKAAALSYWYFQVREAREIRDFTLTMNLPDLPKSKLNYPDGCMTPTQTSNPQRRAGECILTYRLDHALTDKGMGISLPELPQPGQTTRAVLNEASDAWLFVFAVLTCRSRSPARATPVCWPSSFRPPRPSVTASLPISAICCSASGARPY
jgi:hypothetical protein